MKPLASTPTDDCAYRELLLEGWRPTPGYLTPTRAQRIAECIFELSPKEIDQIGRYFLSGCPVLKEENHA